VVSPQISLTALFTRSISPLSNWKFLFFAISSSVTTR
jgi:hypothetical protein